MLPAWIPSDLTATFLPSTPPIPSPRAFSRHRRTPRKPWGAGRAEVVDRPHRRSGLFDELTERVGDIDPLMRLDAEPLPDEPFDWPTVDAADRPFAGAVLDLSDRCCEEMLDVEFRTMTRRILARVAARDPRALRRSTNARRFAAGLVWLAGRANGKFGRRGRWTSQRLWRWFGVSDRSDRGRSLRSAAGLEPETHELRWSSNEPLTLGDAGLLHSRVRRRVIAQRDALAQIERGRRAWSIPDAHALVRMVQRTLVEAGKASSVSGFVQHAVGLALDDVAGWGVVLAQALHGTGGALSSDERAWADEVLGIPKRRKRRAARLPVSRSTREA